ncbi:haloacid dehalogenase [Alphaproteobacteria bacterium]|nr:haloacid dehalogenase [Alphaproteobacteria bacterium]
MICQNVAELLEQYDSFFIDVYGVIYDGFWLFPGVKEMLKKMKDLQKKVIIVSNSPLISEEAMAIYEKFGLEHGVHYDEVVTSGQAFLMKFRDKIKNATCFSWVFDRNDMLFSNLDLKETQSLDEADFIYVGKLTINKESFSVDNLKTKSGQEILLEELVTTDYHEIVGFEKFAEILDKCLELKRPFVVINPDIFAIEKVNDKKRPILCQGGIGEFYERAGGEVLYFGKPYQTIFDFAKNFIKNCSKTAMIGDTPWTDILGGNMANLDTILVLKGVSASFLGEITDQNISEKIDKLITEISLKMTHKSFLNQSMRPTHIAKNFAENL